MNFFRNLSQAFRALLRNPISTIVAVGVLALGIGATTAIFTIIDAALIRPLPGVRDPANLVLMQRIQGGQMLGNFGYPDFRDYRNQARSFSGIAASGATSLSFNHGDVTERVSGRIVSGNYFSILGVRPVEGRLIQDVDEESRAANAVLSFGFWQRAFASDPSAVGRVIELNRECVHDCWCRCPEFQRYRSGRVNGRLASRNASTPGAADECRCD